MLFCPRFWDKGVLVNRLVHLQGFAMYDQSCGTDAKKCG